MRTSNSRRGCCAIGSRRTSIFIVFIMLMWTYTFINYSMYKNSEPDIPESEQLRRDILDSSKQYVKALAKEQNLQGNLPEAYKSFDLKKTMAVLLDSILERLTKLEKKVDSAIANGTFNLRNISSQEPSNNDSDSNHYDEGVPVRKLLVPFGPDGDPDSRCGYTASELENYQHCTSKITWMTDMWKSDPCYEKHGVDGSKCSIIVYLSEVEQWCPKLPWRLNENVKLFETPTRPKASIQLEKEGLLRLLSEESPEKFEWIKTRIERMWDTKWVPAAQNLQNKYNMTNRVQKKILIHLGLLTKESGFKIAESTSSGGPLGELVQWSDIIASLYILGHSIKISVSSAGLKAYLKSKGVVNQNCPLTGENPLDLIYIDIVGLKQFKKASGPLWHQFSCMLRVVDSFGTEPAFNLDTYVKRHGTKSNWGKWNLMPRQFYNMFPHTPDNSFMGFVVENTRLDTYSDMSASKGNRALVYGKSASFWLDQSKYLETISRKFEIHATVFVNESNSAEVRAVPLYVNNHGVVPGKEFQTLLKKTKLFIGLGFPYEGPASLEAIANGCIFLNPKFDPPKSSQNTKFFHGKPTQREINNAPQDDQPKLSPSGNIMITEKLLQAGIFNAAVCIQCKERGLVVRLAESEGWASKIEISCFRCGNETSFWSSPSLPTGKGRSGKAINRALNIGMRAIGKSHSAGVTLSGFLDMPPPVSSGPWANHTSAVLDKVIDLTEQARFEAARRLKRLLIRCNLVASTVPSDEFKTDSYIDSLIVDIAVSFDGSWKNRGNQSHHCTTTAISMDTGEVLDTEYLCNSCSECNQMKQENKDTDSVEYLSWVITHLPQCPKNFEGSSQAAESEGIVRLYERSKDTGLRYTTFIGDGDSKSFRTIERMKPYGEGVIITKEECLGHIRKRMGTNLRKCLDKNGGNKLWDGRTLGGAGRLTKDRIDSFQYFYGQALLSNKGNAQAARDEILACLLHYSTEPDHSKCPDRWCKRKRDPTLPPVKNPLAPAIVELIKPIFELTSQHPYAEVFIGKPHVWTVDISNSNALEQALDEILEVDELKANLPYEYTSEGMLQRLNVYIENQDFCKAPFNWPPKSSMQITIAQPGQSCKNRCREDDLICEPGFFKYLNTKEALEREYGIECQTVEAVEEIYAPSFRSYDRRCYLQVHDLLYSCAGGKPDIDRLCPCRDYIKGQVALCKNCLN